MLKFKTEFTFEAVFFKLMMIGVQVGNVPQYEVAVVQKSMVADVP